MCLCVGKTGVSWMCSLCAELSCFAVAPCAQTMVSEDVCLALAFIILLHLAGISHGFSTNSVLGPFFFCAVWLPYLDSLLDVACQPADPVLSFVSAVTVCPHRFPFDFSGLGAYVPLLWSIWFTKDPSLRRLLKTSCGSQATFGLQQSKTLDRR